MLACDSNVIVTMKADLMETARGVADEALLRSHYADSLKSPELAARLDALNRPH